MLAKIITTAAILAALSGCSPPAAVATTNCPTTFAGQQVRLTGTITTVVGPLFGSTVATITDDSGRVCAVSLRHSVIGAQGTRVDLTGLWAENNGDGIRDYLTDDTTPATPYPTLPTFSFTPITMPPMPTFTMPPMPTSP